MFHHVQAGVAHGSGRKQFGSGNLDHLCTSVSPTISLPLPVRDVYGSTGWSMESNQQEIARWLFSSHISFSFSVLTETPPTFAPPHRTLSITMTTFDERMLQQCRCHACGGLNNIDTPLFIRLLYLFSIIQNGAKKEKQKEKNGRSVKQIFCESNR